MSAWHWSPLGRFRILAAPLPTNPAFTTHRIFLGEEFIASQLSVPSLQQCEDRLSEKRLPPSMPPPVIWKGWSSTQKRKRAAREYAELEFETVGWG